jgi:hypothetical protein
LLLAAIAEALPGAARPPAELQMLPDAGRIAGSEGFVREGFLGLSELRNCLHALYRIEQQEFQIFAILPEPDVSAGRVWQSLAGKWTALSNAGQPALIRRIPYKGPVVLLQTPHGIWGITGHQNWELLLAVLNGLIQASADPDSP